MTSPYKEKHVVQITIGDLRVTSVNFNDHIGLWTRRIFHPMWMYIATGRLAVY